MVTLTEGELAEKTPAERKAHFAAEERTVFGNEIRRDGKGRPIEVGHGAPGHETSNHWAAMRKREEQGLEPEGTTDRMMAEAAKRAKG